MQIKLIFDGGGNKTMEAYGSFQITYDDNGDPVEIVSREIFGIGFTNNEAEYKTFISALEYLLNHLDTAGIAPFDVELTILGDSDLVRKQVGTYAREADTYVWSGWKVNKLHLRTITTLHHLLLFITPFLNTPTCIWHLIVDPTFWC